MTLFVLACVILNCGNALTFGLEELTIPGSLNPSNPTCEPYLSDTLIVFVCSSGAQYDVGFFYFDGSPVLYNNHTVHVQAVTHVQTNNTLAAVTVLNQNGKNGVYLF